MSDQADDSARKQCCKQAYEDGFGEHIRVRCSNGVHETRQLFVVDIERADGARQEFRGDGFMLLTVGELTHFVARAIRADVGQLMAFSANPSDDLSDSQWIEFLLPQIMFRRLHRTLACASDSSVRPVCCESAHRADDGEHIRVLYQVGAALPRIIPFTVTVERAPARYGGRPPRTEFDGNGLLIGTMRDLSAFVAERIELRDGYMISPVNMRATDKPMTGHWHEFVIERT